MQITSLAALKRFLAQPGATILMLEHSYISAEKNLTDKEKSLFEPRTVMKLQTNGVQFSNGSWLYWDNGTRAWEFTGDGFKATPAAGSTLWMKYKCWVAEPVEG